ncbi:YesL family protein [Aquibacillus sediminis]|uniref:YesL family protein n=1 Tax=Aquibacillus sediminis TaxID=2574734 RepID=UPI001109FF32|nr:YesL family protein [Aquibacillus sediminis]
MNGKQTVSSLDLILRWFTRVATVNILWIVFSLFGLLIGGVFPATIAALGICRKWLRGEHDIKIWQVFKRVYRQEFYVSNMVGWLLTIIGIVLYVNYRLIGLSAGEFSFVVPFAFYFILFFYTIIVIWIFPLLVHYQTSWLQQIKNALIIGLTKIHYTLANGIILMLVIYFSLKFPGIIPFFSFSLITLGIMYVSIQVFNKIDNNKNVSI